MSDAAVLATPDFDVPKMVRIAMVRAGKKVRDLQEPLTLSYSRVNERLNGQIDFRSTELIVLGKFLGVHPSFFYGDPAGLQGGSTSARLSHGEGATSARLSRHLQVVPAISGPRRRSPAPADAQAPLLAVVTNDH